MKAPHQSGHSVDGVDASSDAALTSREIPKLAEVGEKPEAVTLEILEAGKVLWWVWPW